VDWRAGASWMQRLLLDGDQASNTLSWQWVASTFGSKPYFFNKENDLLFKVCERKEHTRLKPKIYLVNRTQDNKFNFISSLYPNEQGNYIAEYQKIYYNVTLTETSLTIKRLNPYV
jgi:hypothetical protein